MLPPQIRKTIHYGAIKVKFYIKNYKKQLIVSIIVTGEWVWLT